MGGIPRLLDSYMGGIPRLSDSYIGATGIDADCATLCRHTTFQYRWPGQDQCCPSPAWGGG